LLLITVAADRLGGGRCGEAEAPEGEGVDGDDQAGPGHGQGGDVDRGPLDPLDRPQRPLDRGLAVVAVTMPDCNALVAAET